MLKNLKYHQKEALKIRIFNTMLPELTDNENYELQGFILSKLGIFEEIESLYPHDTYVGGLRQKGFKSTEDLAKMAQSNFEKIAELASRLTTGNVSHNGNTITGIARRNADFIFKYYR